MELLAGGIQFRWMPILFSFQDTLNCGNHGDDQIPSKCRAIL